MSSFFMYLQQLYVGDLTIELILFFIPAIVNNAKDKIKFWNIRYFLHIMDNCVVFSINGCLDRGLHQIDFNTNMNPTKEI